MPACSRFATPRRPERRTLGGHVAQIGEHVGRPLLPWQRQVADVAFELLPDGRLAYRRVIVTVPRQQGKTLLTACVLALRAQDVDQRLAYAAQTGLEGRRKWRDNWIPLLTPLGADFNMANGQETIAGRLVPACGWRMVHRRACTARCSTWRCSMRRGPTAMIGSRRRSCPR